MDIPIKRIMMGSKSFDDGNDNSAEKKESLGLRSQQLQHWSADCADSAFRKLSNEAALMKNVLAEY